MCPCVWNNSLAVMTAPVSVFSLSALVTRACAGRVNKDHRFWADLLFVCLFALLFALPFVFRRTSFLCLITGGIPKTPRRRHHIRFHTNGSSARAQPTGSLRPQTFRLTHYVIEWNQTNKKFRFAVSPHLVSADDKVSLYSARLKSEILLNGTLKL
jgi:hypothetical protein